MAFTGSENHHITLPEAAEMTAYFRNNHPGETLGYYFGRNAIEAILAQPGCVGIRIYNGQGSNGDRNLIITGVDANENDIFSGELVEFGAKCPPHCSTPNPLNS